MSSSAEIRQKFLNFFRERQHTIVPSAPIVLKNDPSLMFTNAGMNQFKDIFLGNQKPKSLRIADTQKCLRVSGKHNDLEEVGIDTYHHTMFEMLGNWSFGDYFKKETIEWAWELLTKVYGISKDRLYVTIFEGDKKENLERDTEVFNEWKKWISEDRIINGNKKDNFWEMGDTGPCGPCSEIHCDTRPDSERKKTDGKSLVNTGDPQVIEIWNLVFIQYNRKSDGQLEPLPAKHVDTGMGFERLTRVLQNKNSNYDTDIFQPIINVVEQKSKIKYGAKEKSDIAMRVIADHIRAISFCIADGQLPSNTGAGYVIRRILRRAVRYGYSYLNFDKPALFELVPVLSKEFVDVFSELKKQEEFVAKVIFEEEQSFLETLRTGLKLIEKINENISGKIAFELYDTYGFPLDLTKLIAHEKGFTVDEKGFVEEMQKQKTRSRKATAIESSDWTELKPINKVEFLGYDKLESDAEVIKYRTVKQKDKTIYQIVLDKTPFYAESGGQVGDKGTLQFGDEIIDVIDTKKENELIIHFVDKLPKTIEGKVFAKVDVSLRNSTANNHTATHLLHAALRKVLGIHVQQKGSLVAPDYLRFDFSHFAKMTDEETEQVEWIVNEKIRENIVRETKVMPLEEAMKTGAMALFGEKYGDKVRVVTFDEKFSRELCGGTHVNSTGQLGYFFITSEGAVAAGVRRIEAITGEAAANHIIEVKNELKKIAELLGNPKDIEQGLNTMLSQNNVLKKEVEKLSTLQVSVFKEQLKQKVHKNGAINFIGELVDLNNAEAIKKLAYELRNEVNDLFLVLGAVVNDKPQLTIIISDNLVADKNLDASKIVKEAAKEIKGGGGGQKFYATAGGTDATGLGKAIEYVKNLIV
jgi:alanyl-tRNA synthetase